MESLIITVVISECVKAPIQRQQIISHFRFIQLHRQVIALFIRNQGSRSG